MKSFLFPILIGLSVLLTGCAGMATDARFDEPVGSAEHNAACDDREDLGLAVNTAGYFSDMLCPDLICGVPVSIIRSNGADALNNPTTQHINNDCAARWDRVRE